MAEEKRQPDAHLDAEFKLCGSGFGICEIQFTKGTDVKRVLQFLNGKILN